MNVEYARKPHLWDRMSRKHLLVAAVLLPVITLFFFLSIQKPVCTGDCNGYILLMGKAPWQGSYWELLHHGFRGWTIPVLFSAFGHFSMARAQGIVVAQAVLLLAATVVFAAAVASRFAPSRRWWVGIAFAIMLAFQQGYLLISMYLLSDTLAWVFVLLLLSTILVSDRLLQRFGYLRFATFYLTLGWMATGARDSNQQLFLIFTAYLVIMRYPRLTARQIAALIAGVLCICALEGHYARIRYRVNMENVLVGRILPDAESRSFFLHHGMPAAYADLGKSLSLQPLDAVNNDAVLEGRARLDRIGTPYVEVAFKTYALWLLTHPGRVAHLLYSVRDRVFPDDFLWVDAAPTHLALRRKLLVLRPSLIEHIPLSLRFLLIFLVPAWGVWQNSRDFFRGVGGFALLVSTTGIVNACSGFIADAWEVGEMERHAAIGNMLFNTGTLILLLWASQELLLITANRFNSHTAARRTRVGADKMPSGKP
jgi:hypothetical protein